MTQLLWKMRPAAWKASSRWWAALACILAVALLLRLAYLRQVAALPFFDQPVGDSAAHLERASRIAAGFLLPPRPFYYCSIFYPYYLALALAAFHGSLYAVCAIQALAGVVVVGLIAWLGRSLYGPLAGLAAGVLAALYGPFAFFEADVLGVVWGQLALVIGMAACIRWAELQKAPRGGNLAVLALAGLAFGLAVVERPNLLVVVPLAAGWCVAQAGRLRRAVRAAAAVAGGAVLPLATVLALNVTGTGQWVPLTTSFGINLSLGYHEGATGTYHEPWERTAPEFSARHTEPEEAMTAMASIETGRELTPREASAYWGRKAVEFIRTHPAQAAGLTVRKVALMLNGAEVPNHLDYEFIREHAPALWLMPVGFGGVLALAAVGIGDSLRTRRQRAVSALLLLVSMGAMLSVVPFTVADRYRAPMVPALIVAAGAGIAALARLVGEPHERSDRRVLLVLIAGLLATLVTLVPLQRPLRGRDWWMFAQAHQAHGNFPAAAAAYEAAIREEGDQGELLNNLAMTYRAMGDHARAIIALRRAISANPALALPRKNLGMLLAARGVTDSALVQLQAAGEIDPRDPEVLGAMGALLAERGDSAAAARAFARARELAPTDGRLLRLMERFDSTFKTPTSPVTSRR